MNDERKSIISLTIIAFPLVFIIIAVLLSFNMVRNYTVLSETVPIKATVVFVEEDSYSDSDGFYHDVYHTKVNYEYDGQEYSNISLGTLSTKHKIGDTFTIKISKDSPSNAYTTDFMDVVFPTFGALVMGAFGCFLLFKFVKWQIKDIIKEKRNGKKIIAFKLPSKGEWIVGLLLASIVTVFIMLNIFVLNGMIIGAIIFGFFLLMWADLSFLK